MIIVFVNKQTGLTLYDCLIWSNQSHDYRPKWTPLSPITIINLDEFSSFQNREKRELLALKRFCSLICLHCTTFEEICYVLTGKYNWCHIPK